MDDGQASGDEGLVALLVRLPAGTHAAFKAMAGPRGMSPTVRALVEEHVAQQAVLERIEAEHGGRR